MPGVDELDPLHVIIRAACVAHNEWADQQRQVKQRMQANPEEAVAAHLFSRGFRHTTPVFEALTALQAPVEFRPMLHALQAEWDGYKRGLRTHRGVWVKYFRSDVPGEQSQYTSGQTTIDAFNQNVTFLNLMDNPIWYLGRSNVPVPPLTLHRVGMALRFPPAGPVLDPEAITSAVIVNADVRLCDKVVDAVKQMRSDHVKMISEYETAAANVRLVGQTLNLDGMLSSFQSETFATLGQPRPEGVMLKEQADDVRTHVDEWIKLFKAGRYNDILSKAEADISLEKQILRCMAEPGYNEQLKTAQRLHYRNNYHVEMSTLYSNLMLDVATRCKASADLIPARGSKFKTLLMDVYNDATGDYSMFHPRHVKKVDDERSQLIIQDHYARMSQLDAIRTTRQHLGVFRDRLRADSQPDLDEANRMQLFAMTLNTQRVETGRGQEWVRDTRQVILSLGLPQEAAMEGGVTYEALLKEFVEALQQILEPAWMEFARIVRPMPALPANPPACAFNTPSEPILKVIQPIASRILKQRVPADIDPSAAIQLRVALEAIASKPVAETRKMDELCTWVYQLAQGLLLQSTV